MRVRRRAKIRREEFSETQRAHLLTGGRGLFFADQGYGSDIEAAAADWAEHRDELLAFWFQNPTRWRKTHRETRSDPAPGGPGSRPWAWWAFDSPRELRRVLGGDVPWVPVVSWARETSFGCPTRFVAEPRGMRLEAEAIYLLRHGFLTDPERCALGLAAATRARRAGQ